MKKHVPIPRKAKPDRFILIGAFALVTLIVLNIYTITDMRIEQGKTNKMLNMLASDKLKTNSTAAGTVGNYNVPLQLIRVWGNERDPYNVWRTANHEVAHYLDFEIIHASESRRYQEIFNTTTEYASDYAKTNIVEDFAETFQAGMVFCFDLSMIPEDRQDYFEKKVLPHFPECKED